MGTFYNMKSIILIFFLNDFFRNKMMSFQNILSHMIPIKTNLTLSFLVAMHYNKRCFIGSPFSIPYMPNGQWTWLNLFFCNKLWKFIVPHLWKCFCYKPSRLWTTSLDIGADYDMYFFTFFKKKFVSEAEF